MSRMPTQVLTAPKSMPRKFKAVHDRSPFVGRLPRLTKNRANHLSSTFGAAFGWEHVGQGVFGVTFRGDASTVRALPRRLKTKKVWRMPQKGPVLIKIVPRPEGPDLTPEHHRQWRKACLRELYMHADLTAAKCKVVASQRFCPKEFVPALYFGGYDPTTECFVMCMEFVSGESLHKIVKERRLTKDAYLRIERGILALSLAGVLHNDFHDENVMIDLKSGRVTFIDFGQSTRLVDLFGGDYRKYQLYLEWVREFIKTKWPIVSFYRHGVNAFNDFLRRRGVQNTPLYNRMLDFGNKLNSNHGILAEPNYFRNFSNIRGGLSEQNRRNV